MMKITWTKADKNKVKKIVEYYIYDLRERGFDVRELEEIKFTHAVNVHGWCRTYANSKLFTLGISCYRVADGEEALKETILHELCHAIASYGAGHGKEWQYLCEKVGSIYGVHIERCRPHSIKVEEAANRFVVKCDNCGAVWEYMRRTKFVRAVMENNTSKWKCGCGSHHFSMVKGGN